jgi:hypothetical protein
MVHPLGVLMKNRYILIAAASFLSTSVAFADVTIGNGFKCEGSSILKGTKVVSFTKAKSTLVQTIANLKKKLATASKKKRPGIKAQIQTANLSKTLLKTCSVGKLDIGQVDPIFTQLASGSGLYSGTYGADVTFVGHISGDMSMLFQLQGTVFSGTLTLGGPLGTSLHSQPLAFQQDVGGIGFPAQFFLTNTFLGDVTLSVTQAGHLSITNSNQSKPADFEGDFANQTIACTLNGSYSIVSYSGSATLTRQP